MPRRAKLPSETYARPIINLVTKDSPWFIGIDQSSTNNGLAAYHAGHHTIYTTNFLCGKNNVELIERLYRLERFLEAVVYQTKPQQFYTEEIHPGNRHAYAVLLKVESTIHSMLYRCHIPYVTISANVIQKSSWPAQLKIKGSKEHIRIALTGIADPLSTEHELDAVGVLLGALVRDKLITLDLVRTVTINRVDNCNEFPTILGSIDNTSIKEGS